MHCFHSHTQREHTFIRKGSRPVGCPTARRSASKCPSASGCLSSHCSSDSVPCAAASGVVVFIIDTAEGCVPTHSSANFSLASGAAVPSAPLARARERTLLGMAAGTPHAYCCVASRRGSISESVCGWALGVDETVCARPSWCFGVTWCVESEADC